MCSKLLFPFCRGRAGVQTRAADFARSEARNCDRDSADGAYEPRKEDCGERRMRPRALRPVSERSIRIFELPEQRDARPIPCSRLCYAEPYTGHGLGMRPRNLVCITLLAVCHLPLGAQAPQVLTNALPSAQRETGVRRGEPRDSGFGCAAGRSRPGNGACGQAGASARNRDAGAVGSEAPSVGRATF